MLESQIHHQRRSCTEKISSSRKDSMSSMDLDWPQDVRGDEYHLQEIEHDEEVEMDDDRDWCSDSLAVELSSVESAAMNGIMGLLHGASSSESIASRINNSSSSKSPEVLPSTNSLGKTSHRGTSHGGSAEDSDGCSITSYASTLRGQDTSISHHRSSGSTGDASVVFPMAPPSSPNTLHLLGAQLNTSSGTPFTTPPVRRGSTSSTDRTRSSGDKNFAVKVDIADALFSPRPHLPKEEQHSSSPLLISIPENENEHWRHAHEHPHDHMHAGMHLSENFVPCEYTVEEVDSDVDSTATVLSLAVEVESLDEEGTYMSYGGDCEEIDGLEYSVEYTDSHSLHSSGHLYLGGEDPDAEVFPEVHAHPVGYTYGHPLSSGMGSSGSGGSNTDRGSAGSAERRRYHRRGFSVGSDTLEMHQQQPSPPPLYHPRVRKSYSDLQSRNSEEGPYFAESFPTHSPELVRSFSTDHTTLSGGTRESTGEEYMYTLHRPHSASPSAMFETDLPAHYFSSTQDINTVDAGHTPYLPHPHHNTTHNHNTTLNNTLSNAHHAHSKHRSNALKNRPTHPEPFLSPSYVYNNLNKTVRHLGATGAGKRKRSDSSSDSPRAYGGLFDARETNFAGDSKKPFIASGTKNIYRGGSNNITSSSSNTSNTTINIYSGYAQHAYSTHYSDANTDTDSMVEGEGGYDAASEKGLES